MRAMLLAFAAIIAIAFAADYTLDRLDYSAADRSASPNVRLE